MAAKGVQEHPAPLESIVTVRDFLWRCYLVKRSLLPKLTFAQLARWGGFGSRSNVRLMLLGGKSVTLESLENFLVAFRLSESQRAFARALFLSQKALPHRDRDPKTFEKCEAQLLMARQKLIKEEEQKMLSIPPAVVKLLMERFSTRWMRVFAGLGTCSGEATPLRILSHMSGVSLRETKEILSTLAVHRWVICQEDNRWWTSVTFIDQSGLEDDVLRESFLENSRRLLSVFQRRGGHSKKSAADADLFLMGEFLVRKEDGLALKKALREAVLKTVSAFQIQSGNDIISLSLGLIHS